MFVYKTCYLYGECYRGDHHYRCSINHLFLPLDLSYTLHIELYLLTPSSAPSPTIDQQKDPSKKHCGRQKVVVAPPVSGRFNPNLAWKCGVMCEVLQWWKPQSVGLRQQNPVPHMWNCGPLSSFPSSTISWATLRTSPNYLGPSTPTI